jgi:RsiW-degrading membrane proteinase PrsW (M82 family)
MNLDVIIGLIAGVGVFTGVITIVKGNKKMGMIQLVLTIIAPVVTSFWCAKKLDFVFGGTDWEFLIQTAFVDKMIEPWLIFALYIISFGFIIFNIIQTKKRWNINFPLASVSP